MQGWEFRSSEQSYARELGGLHVVASRFEGSWGWVSFEAAGDAVAGRRSGAWTAVDAMKDAELMHALVPGPDDAEQGPTGEQA